MVVELRLHALVPLLSPLGGRSKRCGVRYTTRHNCYRDGKDAESLAELSTSPRVARTGFGLTQFDKGSQCVVAVVDGGSERHVLETVIDGGGIGALELALLKNTARRRHKGDFRIPIGLDSLDSLDCLLTRVVWVGGSFVAVIIAIATMQAKSSVDRFMRLLDSQPLRL